VLNNYATVGVILNLPAICPTFAGKAIKILASLRHGLSSNADLRATRIFLQDRLATLRLLHSAARGILAMRRAVNPSGE
jgi:hypothetical protein